MIFMFATVLFKLKKIEITINPNYDSADAVLNQIKKFLCVSRTVLFICIVFVVLIVLFFLAYLYLREIFNIAFWAPAVFSSVYYLLMLAITCYFMDMGNKFLASLTLDGFEINVPFCRFQFLFVCMFNIFGMLNFSFVQIFNQLNYEYKFVECENNWPLKILSYIISYCYVFGPFVQATYLIQCIKFIAKVNEDGGLEPVDDSETDGVTSYRIETETSDNQKSQVSGTTFSGSQALGSYKERRGSVQQSDKTLSKMNFSFHNISEMVSKKKKPLIMALN